MDNFVMIEKLKRAGIFFEAGLRDEEFTRIESTFGFRFPSEIRAFLACGLPVGNHFYNWRDLSAANVQRFRDFWRAVEDAFLFDLENNGDDLRVMLGDRFSEFEDQKQYAEAVLDYLRHSTKLIPFYAHRCFFDGMDNMPIVSFWQPVDSVFCGENFEEYLETEFLGKEHCVEHIPARMNDTGIWYYLIE